ncbi:MAG: metallophosphoesterase [Acidobacteria bacterium]|nr:metallophosphoesterase [Acidobacteriota bacterium]
MRRIVHISDLHFGRVNQALIEPLLASVVGLRPDVVAVSGDLTQRATEEQFEAARDFLRRIPFPQIVVPGNHDISLWNVYRRFRRPLERYRRYISAEAEPSYVDDRLFLLGLNTARSLAWKEGRISLDQVERLRDQFCALDPHVFKVLVAHHPFAPHAGAKDFDAVGRADLALEALEHSGADLILAGHLHRSYACQTASFYRLANRSILVAQSGTTLSARTRAERNSFNVIDLEPDAARITVHSWDPENVAFVPREPARYEKRGEWRLAGN